MRIIADPVKNVLGESKWKYIQMEIDTCDVCQKLKRDGVLPPVCQEHIDMQFK